MCEGSRQKQHSNGGVFGFSFTNSIRIRSDLIFFCGMVICITSNNTAISSLYNVHFLFLEVYDMLFCVALSITINGSTVSFSQQVQGSYHPARLVQSPCHSVFLKPQHLAIIPWFVGSSLMSTFSSDYYVDEYFIDLCVLTTRCPPVILVDIHLCSDCKVGLISFTDQGILPVQLSLPV